MSIITYKFRLSPTKNQRVKLGNILEECRWLYNHFLEQRKTAWESDKKNLSCYDQMKLLPALKRAHPSLKTVYAQSLQEVPYKIDRAFTSFFRRVKLGQTPGYPRFKGRDRLHSFSFPQANYGYKLIGNKQLRIAKVGHVKIKMHRTMPDAIKTCTITKSPSGKWYACFSCEVAKKLLKSNDKKVALDVGIKTFATLSNEDVIPNPKFFKQSQDKLAKAQKKLAKLEKGSVKRAKARKIVCRIHEKIANQRNNFCHQVSRALVNNFGTIIIEDIQVNKMIKKENLNVFNRSQTDTAWSLFFNFLTYKAEDAGRLLVKVNPAYTSQDCSTCGTRQLMPLSQRTYSCEACGLELDRDYNAALNILRLGTQSLAQA